MTYLGNLLALADAALVRLETARRGRAGFRGLRELPRGTVELAAGGGPRPLLQLRGTASWVTPMSAMAKFTGCKRFHTVHLAAAGSTTLSAYSCS